MEDLVTKRGRPPGRGSTAFPVVRSFRLTERDLEELHELAAAWRTTATGALRRAVQEAAQQVRQREVQP